MLSIIDKKCMGMQNPVGIRPARPEFSWIIDSDMHDTVQETYQIQVRSLDGTLVWDSGSCSSGICSAVFYDGEPLRPRTCYEWTLAVTDNHGQTAVRRGDLFETGFSEGEPWTGKWISPKQEVVPDAFCDWPADKLVEHFGPVDFVGLDMGNPDGVAPAYYLRKSFGLLPKKRSSARLYITAGGIYDVSLNGKPVTDTLFNPGFTPYDKYFEYQTFDVTGLLEQENVIGVILADGWYKGRNGIGGLRNLYGKQTKLLAELHVRYEDGTTDIIATDDTWISSKGPYEYADLFVGEFYDARKDLGAWDCAGYIPKGWTAVTVLPHTDEVLKGICAPPAGVVEHIRPASVYRNDIGELILDMGQNIAGFVRATFYNQEPGAHIVFEHTEMLDERGHYMNSINPDCRELIDHYICCGKSSETYCPRFTFHGFRYVRISGLKGQVRAEDFEGLVVASRLDTTMDFQCSNPDITRLQSNIFRSQQGNFLGIPTDCPQREKAGWTGDVFVYSDTASYVQDVRMFLKRWLEMVRMEQFANGIVPVTVPYTKNYYYIQDCVFQAHTSCGWGDAIIEVPWVLYQQYGDISFLTDNYDAMKKWIGYVEKEASEGRTDDYEKMPLSQQERQPYLWNTGFHYGDWSYPSCRNEKGETDNLQSSINTREYVATALYAHSCEVFSKVAAVLSKDEDARYYRTLRDRICKAYEEEYIRPDGQFPLPIQGLYVLTLAMGLVSEEKAGLLARHLNQLILDNGGGLDTGFMSIKFLLDVLCRYGYTDTAKTLLLQEKCPSWLYEVKHDATTVWSKWNAIQPETGKVTCASYNHYSFGSVGKWMYNYILGIRNTGCGFRDFVVEPGFDYPFQWACGSYHCVYGDIRVAWARDGRERSIDLTVPVSTHALIRLKDCDTNSLSHYFKDRMKDGYVSLGSGTYHICYQTRPEM